MLHRKSHALAKILHLAILPSVGLSASAEEIVWAMQHLSRDVVARVAAAIIAAAVLRLRETAAKTAATALIRQTSVRMR